MRESPNVSFHKSFVTTTAPFAVCGSTLIRSMVLLVGVIVGGRCDPRFAPFFEDLALIHFSRSFPEIAVLDRNRGQVGGSNESTIYPGAGICSVIPMRALKDAFNPHESSFGCVCLFICSLDQTAAPPLAWLFE